MSKVSLTFDNGPEPLVTPHVLECLRRHQARATFFVLGQNASTAQGGELVLRAQREGHRVGSHTWSHSSSLGTMDAATAVAEFERGAEAIERLGIRERLFRPPGRGTIGQHLLHPAVVPKLTEGGFTCVLWNSVPGDYRDPDGWMPRALAGIGSREWTLLVLHDHLPNGAMAHLDSFLDRLQSEGHEIVDAFPPECVPILKGRAVTELQPYLATA